MQLTFLARAVGTIGLMTMLTAIECMSLVKTVQAQAKPQTRSVCSAAYFDNPGYMYNPATKEQIEAYDRFEQDPDRMKKWNSLILEAKTFSAPLDSPMGYVLNKVNGKTVRISPQIARAIGRDLYHVPGRNNRQQVAKLNQKYGKYATFGQNIILVLSSEQSKQHAKYTYESLAYISSMMTPQERQAERDARTAAGDCSIDSLFKSSEAVTLSVDVGVRPDLDRRLREDKTGATFFK